MSKRRKKKKYKGQYCHVCGAIKSNESFSGKGHAAHVCKQCTSLPKADQQRQSTITKLYNLVGHSHLSDNNKLFLQAKLRSSDAAIRAAADDVRGSYHQFGISTTPGKKKKRRRK